MIAPLLVTLVLVPFRDELANAAAALILLAVVLVVALSGRRSAGVLAALASATFFDFFLTRPYQQLSISSAHDIETTVALLAVGVAVTEITIRARRHYVVARDEGYILALIHDLSDLVATGADTELIVTTAADDLRHLLGLTRCHFEARHLRKLRPQLGRNAEVEAGEVRFAVDRDGMPAESELVTRSGGKDLGRFVMEGATRARPVSIEERVAALALADIVGAALASVSPDQARAPGESSG